MTLWKGFPGTGLPPIPSEKPIPGSTWQLLGAFTGVAGDGRAGSLLNVTFKMQSDAGLWYTDFTMFNPAEYLTPQRYASALRKLSTARATGAIDHDSAVLLEATLWEGARERGIDTEVDAILADG